MKLVERGFTLIEVLIVVAIVGVVGSIIALSSRSAPSRLLEAEADRLIQLLSMARDEAELSGQPLALTFSTEGYVFQKRDRRGRWHPFSDDLLRPRQWPFQVAGLRLEPGSPGNKLYFEPAGRMLPFTLSIETAEQRVAISGDALGRYYLQPKP